MSIKLFICCFALGLSVAYAQHFNIRKYNVEDGLAQAYALTLEEDRNGIIWIGTVAGLSRFDGKKFENYNTKDGLADNFITSSLKDYDGNLWFGHVNGGLTYYDVSADSFVDYTYIDSLPQTLIRDIFEDVHGYIWLATNTDGCYRFDGHSFVHYDLGSDSLNMVHGITEDAYDNLWFATDGGVAILKNEPGEPRDLYFRYLGVKDGLQQNSLRSILSSRKGDIWIGGRGPSVLQLTGDPFKKDDFFNLLHLNHRLGIQLGRNRRLADAVVRTIFEDRSGKIWLGTLNGVIRYTYPERNIYAGNAMKMDLENGLSHNTIWSILEDREGSIWFGTQGGGVSQLINQTFETFNKKHGLSHDEVWSIRKVNSGEIWLGTSEGLNALSYREAGSSNFDVQIFATIHGLNHNYIHVLKDYDQSLWIGTWGRGLNRMDLRTNGIRNVFETPTHIRTIVPGHGSEIYFGARLGVYKYNYSSNRTSQLLTDIEPFPVFSLLKDLKGHIWIGTGGQGVLKLVHERSVEFEGKAKLAGLTIYCISEDQDGGIWFGTKDEGVFHLENEKLRQYTHANGLSSDNIYLLHGDRNNRIWIGSSTGLDRLDPETGEIRHYGKSEGFLGVEANLNAVYEDKDGHIWFGTVNGVTKYYPEHDVVNTIEPITRIHNLRIALRDAPFPKKPVFSYEHNHLTFDFIAISLKAPQNVRYSYMLEGIENEWSPVTEQTFATYPNLPPGTYNFKVKACNNDGVWNKEPAIYKFTVSPPYWKSTWFFLLCLTIIVGIIYIIMKLRLRSIELEKKNLARKVEERTREIRKNTEMLAKTNEELKKLSIVASKTDNAVMIFDSNGLIEWVNDGFKTMSGYDSLEAFKSDYGSSIYEISSNPEIREAVAESIKERKSITYESSHYNTKGDLLWASSTVTPVLTGNGKLDKIVAIYSDITDLKRAEQEIKDKNLQLSKKNKDITDSINYAKNIQKAVLPDNKKFKKIFPESFVINWSKDIVGGDFYWMFEKDGRVVLAVVDCTGHGVPGAIMSVIGNNALNRVVIEQGIMQPGAILDALHQYIRNVLKQDRKGSNTQDGMDAALVMIDLNKSTLEFAGAVRPLIHVSEGNLTEVKGNRFSIGGFQMEDKRRFTNQRVEFRKNDLIYMFSDGYTDQFGGEFDKKFLIKRLKEKILENQAKKMDMQNRMFENIFLNWRGKADQIDDVLLIGIRL